MKDELLRALEKAGANDLFDILYDEDMTIERFVKEYPEAKGIPGVLDALQTKSSNAPHGMTEEEKADYFAETPDDRKRYEANESKLAKELSEKQRLADEYQRAKDIEDFAEFKADKGILGNLAALGMKLTPQAAKNVYIKEGYNPVKIGTQAGIGTAANLTELLSAPGKVGKAISTFAGPTIRAGQDLYEGKKLEDVATNFAFDTGLNTLFTYMPVKEAYNYIKRILGQGGEAGEKAIKDKVDEVLEQADLLENKDEALKNLDEQYEMLTQLKEAYKDMSDIDRAKLIKDFENTHPELAKAIEENVNTLGENRFTSEGTKHLLTDNDAVKYIEKKFYDELVKQYGPEKAKQLRELFNPAEFEAYVEKESAKHVPETAKNVDKAFDEAKRRTAEKRVMINDELFDEAGNIKSSVENLSEATTYAKPNKVSKAIATVAPAGRGIARNVVTPARKSVAPDEKENTAAIDWTIDKYKRQWDAGFAPRGNEGDLVMKAYAQYLKDRGEF